MAGARRVVAALAAYVSEGDWDCEGDRDWVQNAGLGKIVPRLARNESRNGAGTSVSRAS